MSETANSNPIDKFSPEEIEAILKHRARLLAIRGEDPESVKLSEEEQSKKLAMGRKKFHRVHAKMEFDDEHFHQRNEELIAFASGFIKNSANRNEKKIKGNLLCFIAFFQIF